MEDLEAYLTKELPKEQRMLDDLEEAIREAIEVFLDGPFDSVKLWPYSVKKIVDDNDYANEPPSRSTAAMILAALQALDPGSRAKRRASSGYPIFANFSNHGFELPRDLQERVTKRIKSAATRLCGVLAKDVEDGEPLTTSPTYGKEDILSLGWLIEIAERRNDKDLLNKIGKILTTRLGHVKGFDEGPYALAKNVLNNSLDPQAEGDPKPGGDPHAETDPQGTGGLKKVVGDSSYILVRFTRLVIAASDELLSNHTNLVTEKIRPALDLLFQRFETRLHDQLSFWEIPDSRFDPAELAFCLEGMLLTQKDSVDDGLFDRVMSVLEETQKRVAYWRTETPMLTQHTGWVLFPVSIETANSILASFALFDGDTKLYDAKASKYIGSVNRYWSWLKARRATVEWNAKTFRGWHSENINDPKLIHTWETSQVLEFLLAFRDQLRRHMGRQSLILSNLKFDRPKLNNIEINGEKIKGNPGDGDIWEQITAGFEPVKDLGDDFRVYNEVGKFYYSPRVVGEYDHSNWSMLLYGPPGTGKSTLGKNFAAALGVPFITITVSDFLGGGEAEVEHRAKMVFKVLELQPLSVVLFDEMDQFMLDRDSKLYKDQDSIFQFLTPGMLTKFADLHDEEAVIFIIATNYVERIDAAIKRPGRVDQQYLMLPFDGKARLRILNGFSGTPSDLSKADDDKKTCIEAASLFLGWGDLKRVASKKPKDIDELELALAKATRTTRLSAYETRFLEPGGNNKQDDRSQAKIEFDKGPIKEFGALLNLAERYWDKLDEDNFAKCDVSQTLAKLLPNDAVKKDEKKEELKKAIEAKGLDVPTKVFT